jgi:hypothetical protein
MKDVDVVAQRRVENEGPLFLHTLPRTRIVAKP